VIGPIIGTIVFEMIRGRDNVLNLRVQDSKSLNGTTVEWNEPVLGEAPAGPAQQVSAPGSVVAGVVAFVAAVASGVIAYVLGGDTGLAPAVYALLGVGVYSLASAFNFFYQALMVRGPGAIAKVVDGKLEIDEIRFNALPTWLQNSILRHEKMHLHFMILMDSHLNLLWSYVKNIMLQLMKLDLKQKWKHKKNVQEVHVKVCLQ